MKTIGEMAETSGLSTRTLRYYEEAGLISPIRTEGGYRMYSKSDERRLAQIIAMRSCNLPLSEIAHLLTDADSDMSSLLKNHLQNLRAQKGSLDAAIGRTEAAIRKLERINDMEPTDAFEELKKQGLEDFEKTYGAQARMRYGDEVIDETNKRMLSLTKDEWDAKELLEKAIKVQLRLAMLSEDTNSAESQELAKMHEKWIGIHWGSGYSEDEYLAMVRGYLNDDRFVKYYDDAAGTGATQFLTDAIDAYHAKC